MHATQQGMQQVQWDDQISRRHSSETVYSNVQFEQCGQAALMSRVDLCDMFMRQPQHMSGLEDLKALTSGFEEDDEMAAARDVVTADLKCFQEGLANCSTPPPAVPGAHAQRLQQQPQQQGLLKQEPSGAAGSTCGGASSPQVSCDTAAARAQQFWAPQQQQYEAAYGLMMRHSPMNELPGTLHAFEGTPLMVGAPCTGPCCNPGMLPQGSCTLPAAAGVITMTDYASMPKPQYPSAFGPAGMIPHAATGMQFSMDGCVMPAAGAAVGGPPPAVMQPQLPKTYSSYPAVQGGVQKKSGTSKPPANMPTRRRSADGSCSSKDGTLAAMPTKAKKSKAAAPPSAPAARSRGSTSAAAAAAAAAGSSTASLIKELQQEIDALSDSKAQLKGQVRNLLNSQTDLLSRVATLTSKWQQAVAENANLQRQLTMLAGRGV